MPRPVLKKININEVIERSMKLSEASLNFKISYNHPKNKNLIKGDEDQLNRAFINLIKNSSESIKEKVSEKPNFKGKIDIEISSNNDYIVVTLKDNGVGISDTKKAMTPYYTTKKKGTGLGLPIISKIFNEHSADFKISNNKNNNGAKAEIIFQK